MLLELEKRQEMLEMQLANATNDMLLWQRRLNEFIDMKERFLKFQNDDKESDPIKSNGAYSALINEEHC